MERCAARNRVESDGSGPGGKRSSEQIRQQLRLAECPWAGATALVVIAVVVLYFFTGAAATAPSRAAPVSSTDITYGPKDAKLTVIEYSDFQCPFCAVYAPILDQLRQKYGDQVQFVYRFYPLANHKWATITAKAAYAAYLQGKFWEMHDLLFKNQDQWAGSSDPRPYLDQYAKQLGLDMTQVPQRRRRAVHD